MSNNYFSRVPTSVTTSSALSTIPVVYLQEGSDCWVQASQSYWVYTSGAWTDSRNAIYKTGTLTVPFTGALGSFNLSVNYQVTGKLVQLDIPASPTSSSTVSTAGTITATIPTLSAPATLRNYECATKNGILSLVAYNPSTASLSTSGVLTIGNGMTGSAGTLINFAVSSLTGGTGFNPFSITYLTS